MMIQIILKQEALITINSAQRNRPQKSQKILEESAQLDHKLGFFRQTPNQKINQKIVKDHEGPIILTLPRFNDVIYFILLI